MIKIKCPNCKIELYRALISLDGEKKEIWTHPPNDLKKCDYQQDGVKVETEVIDPFLMNKFQELIESEGLPSAPLNSEIIVSETVKSDNFQLIKDRLAKGDLMIHEYLKICELLKE